MRIHKSLLFASMLVLATGCGSMIRCVYNNSLNYVNDIGLEASFPESDSTLEEEAFKTIIANVDTGAILFEQLMRPISEELSNTLFLVWYKSVWERDFEPFITDDFPYDSTSRVFEYYLGDRKERETFYYIGEVSLSENYDSYLLAATESEEKHKQWEDLIKDCPQLVEYPNQIYNRVFVVNVKDTIIVSMTMLWWAWNYDFDPSFTYTTIPKQGVFLQKECNIFSEYYHGFRLLNPETWFLHDPTKGVRFKFDDDGRVVVL